MLTPSAKIKYKIDFNEGLTALEPKTLLISLIISFISIFYWLAKILFF